METRILTRGPIGNPRRKWKQHSFMISTFGIQMSTSDIRRAFANLRDAGFKLVEFGWLPVEKCDEALNIAEELGVDVLVQDWRHFGGFQNTRETVIDLDDINIYVERLRAFRHVAGYYVWDEPYKPDDIEKAAAQTDIMEAADPERLPFSVAIPSYNNTYTYRNGQFADYLERYVERVAPPVLSLDFYPFAMHPDDETQLDNSNIYRDLFLMRKLGLEYELPVWFYYQGTPELGDCVITGPKMDMQVNLALLYGAKGIQHYTAQGCVVDHDGSRGELFEETHAVNRRLEAWGRTLMALTSTGVFHSADVHAADAEARAGSCHGIEISRFLAGIPGTRISVGEFADSCGNDYVMVLNRDYVSSRIAELMLRNAARLYEVGAEDGCQKLVEESVDRIAISLKPGEARFFRLQDPEETAYLIDYRLSM